MGALTVAAVVAVKALAAASASSAAAVPSSASAVASAASEASVDMPAVVARLSQYAREAALWGAAGTGIATLVGWAISFRILGRQHRNALDLQDRQFKAELGRIEKQLQQERDRTDKQLSQERDQAAQMREHEAREKFEDRKLALRREVYMRAVEKVQRAIESIARLPDEPMSDSSSLVAFQDCATELARVWTVADMKAAGLTRDLMDCLGAYYFDALKTSVEVRGLMARVAALTRHVEAAEQDIMRIDRDQALAIERNDVQRLSLLSNSLQNAGVALEHYESQRRDVLNKTLPLRAAFMERTAAYRRHVSRALTRLVSALREELHLETDEAAFLRRTEQSEARSVLAAESVFRRPLIVPDVPDPLATP